MKHFNAVKREAKKMVAAYNSSGRQVLLELTSSIVPDNLFNPTENHPAYVLLKFDGDKYWSIRILFYPDRLLALQFVRLMSPDGSSNYETMRLSNDSINLVLLKDQFGVSLNQSMSEAVKANVATGLPMTPQPLEKFEKVATELTRRIIEYEVLPLKASR
ncbi:MAG: hypothetical protein IPK78_13865 [Rhodospirillales bacterium]|nr:hypothetical protein [Rhodospirillales bacterium]